MNCGYEINVSGFIAHLVRALHQNREVTGSNPVEVLAPVVQTMESAICRLNHYPVDKVIAKPIVLSNG